MSILQVYFANVFILCSQNDKQLMDELGKIGLSVYGIEEPYAFKSSFSTVRLRVRDTCTGTFSFGSLFCLQDIGLCPEINWRRQESYSGEKNLFIDMVENIFTKLGEVTLEPSYKSKVVGDVYTPDSQDDSQNPHNSQKPLTTTKLNSVPVTGETGIICDNIGIGDRDAWYGTPHARIRANDSNVLLEWEDSE